VYITVHDGVKQHISGPNIGQCYGRLCTVMDAAKLGWEFRVKIGFIYGQLCTVIDTAKLGWEFGVKNGCITVHNQSWLPITGKKRRTWTSITMHTFAFLDNKNGHITSYICPCHAFMGDHNRL
jgi:hypothetical protein